MCPKGAKEKIQRLVDQYEAYICIRQNTHVYTHMRVIVPLIVSFHTVYTMIDISHHVTGQKTTYVYTV